MSKPEQTDGKVDFEPILWAASEANKDEETRLLAKDILDTLCFIQNMGTAK